MTWFHGTTKENWAIIQEEGILYGRRYVTDNDGNIIKEVDRCTYLTPCRSIAAKYGDIVLAVEFDPHKNPKKNNYVDGCWQMRVYEPISIENVTEIK